MDSNNSTTVLKRASSYLENVSWLLGKHNELEKDEPYSVLLQHN